MISNTKDIAALNQENEALSDNLDAIQTDMSSFAETFKNLQTENESLQQQLDQRYQSMAEHELSRGHSLVESPAIVGRTGSRSLAADMIHPTSLADQGYTEYDAMEEEAIDAPSSGMLTGSNQFRAATVDAQEEFYRLVCADPLSNNMVIWLCFPNPTHSDCDCRQNQISR